MGSRIDALKPVSSLTLFRAAAQRLAAEDSTVAPIAQLSRAILDQTATEGFAPCAHSAAQIIG